VTATPNPVIAIFAPLAADANAISGLVESIGQKAEVCDNAEGFARILGTHPLCAVLTEEALRLDVSGIISDHADEAPLWSSIPLILAISDPDRPSRATREIIEQASLVTLVVLKRPLRPQTFISVCKTQIELRERQFQAAALLDELAEAEHYQKFLLDELQHRTGNMLAILQATVSLASPREGDVEGFRKDLVARIQAIAKAHGRMQSGYRGEEDIQAIISEHVAPFSTAEGQITTDGPSLTLGERQAFDLALIMHELATNAAKYGALSTNKGTVEVTWKQRDAQFCIDWREKDGPAVVPPEKTSFGARMITGLAKQHGGRSELIFEEAGLRATIQMSL